MGSNPSHTHSPEGPASCFGCKIRSLSWGIVPGGARATSSTSYYDNEALPDLPSKEEVMDMRHDYRNAPVRELKVDHEGKPIN
jgi:hypothetical protein